MTSQNGKQKIAILILPNISRSKGSQTMKFGKLIENNMRDTFVEKSYTKCRGETIPRSFSKKSKLMYIFGSVFLKLYAVCFYFMLIQGLSKYSETKL